MYSRSLYFFHKLNRCWCYICMKYISKWFRNIWGKFRKILKNSKKFGTIQEISGKFGGKTGKTQKGHGAELSLQGYWWLFSTFWYWILVLMAPTYSSMYITPCEGVKTQNLAKKLQNFQQIWKRMVMISHSIYMEGWSWAVIKNPCLMTAYDHHFIFV